MYIYIYIYVINNKLYNAQNNDTFMQLLVVETFNTSNEGFETESKSCSP